MLAMIVVCWLVPIIIIMSLAGFLLGRSYQESAQQDLDANAEIAIRQVQLQLEGIIADSKSVSYDGVVRTACRSYRQDGDEVELYRKVSDYLNQKFSRKPQYKAVYINFWNKEVDNEVFMLNRGFTGYEIMQECRESLQDIRRIMNDVETDIRFLNLEGNLYVARNLLDSHFDSYATVVMLLDPLTVFHPMGQLNRIKNAQLCIDDVAFCVDGEGKLLAQDPAFADTADVRYVSEADGHHFCFSADLTEYNLLEANPWMGFAVVWVAFMVLPVLFLVVGLFRHHVTRPMETLVEANQLVQSGQRGYEIHTRSPNAEFDKLYSHFNSMSKELKNQFERSYLEQQAAQKAQIKALQSQINPHFLNNTLEIINWEARLAENDRISAMIEALSTMLGAALDRNGRPQIPLKEEMGYVDAYLYIIQERIGEGFHVHKEIDPAVLPVLIPRLILQPIVENAVEHDISARHEGELWVRAYKEDEDMVLEVEHDGTLTDRDRENIRGILSDDSEATRVGLKNVHRRLKLIYGEQGAIRFTETSRKTILAQLRFPAEGGTERSLP